MPLYKRTDGSLVVSPVQLAGTTLVTVNTGDPLSVNGPLLRTLDSSSPANFHPANYYSGNSEFGGVIYNTVTVICAKRSATNVTDNPGTVTFDFTTGTLSTPANGWSTTIPAGTNDLYFCRAVLSTLQYVDTIAAGDWVGPYLGTGNSALTAVLSNDNQTLPADSLGNVISYTNSGTDIHVYEGINELAYDGVGTANGTWKVIATPTNITVGSITDAGVYATVGNASAFSAGQNSASISYAITGTRVNGGSFSLTYVQTFNKSKDGNAVSVNSNRTANFTATDGTLDAAQADIIFTATALGIASPTYVWTFSGFQTAPTNSGTSTQTITAAQFGTSKAAFVTCTVNGTYVDSITIVRLEKSTAAAGATVGASWNNNITNQPVEPSFGVTNVTQYGNTFTRTGGSGTAWDSQAYSKEGYSLGVFCSFSFIRNTASAMAGLNTDPTTDASYASIDFCWYARGTGLCDIYESGGGVTINEAYTASTVFAITYDGVNVRYYKDGVLKRTVALASTSQFFFDSSIVELAQGITNVKFGPMTSNDFGNIGGSTRPSDNATSDITLIASSGITLVGNKAIKTGGTNGAWDSQVYSKEPIAGGCMASAVVVNTSGSIMFGLNNDPTTDASYGGIDAAFYIAGNQLRVYELGVNSPFAGTVTAGDVLSITYDGTTVTYRQNGTVVRTIALSISPVYFDSSFYETNATISGIKFVPFGATFGSSIGGQINSGNVSTYIANSTVDTLRIAAGSATSLMSAFTSGSVSLPTNSGTHQVLQTLTTGVLSTTESTTVLITISSEVYLNVPGASANHVRLGLYYGSGTLIWAGMAFRTPAGESNQQTCSININVTIPANTSYSLSFEAWIYGIDTTTTATCNSRSISVFVSKR